MAKFACAGKSGNLVGLNRIIDTMSTARLRTLLSAGFLALLVSAIARAPRLPAQAGIPYSKPGQEELTFWVNHNGLEQLDALGEVGFGDMARILMRRRSIAL